MAEHTPTPWKFIDATKKASMQYKPLCIIKSGEKQIAGFSWNDNSPWFPSRLESQANAAFIIKAVNNHAEMVEALKQSRDRLLWIQDVRNGKTSGLPQVASCIEHIDAILSRVGGSPK